MLHAVSWQTNLTQLAMSTKYIMTTLEGQNNEVTILNDGAVSYYINSVNGPAGTQVVTSEFSIVTTDATGALQAAQGNAAAQLDCMPQTVPTDINTYSLRTDDARNVSCWPFSELISFAIMAEYDDSGVGTSTEMANKTLNMLQWMYVDVSNKCPS